MAYKFVDADQLDADLTTVADAIREKGETTDTLAFPDEMAEAIAAISTGIEVQTASGTFTTPSSSSSSTTVTCGFQPDIVVVYKGESESGYGTYTTAFPFAAMGSDTSLCSALWTTSSSYQVYSFVATATSTGFTLTTCEAYSSSFSSSTLRNTSFNYIAVKYTE